MRISDWSSDVCSSDLKAFANLAQIDFFPSQAQRQVDMALQDLELSANRALAPDEPHAVQGAIPRLFVKAYQDRTWATRRRPWADRLACAWLIHRFFDSQARCPWLDSIGRSYFRERVWK